MKHQYFGDLNDYRKYGLLRALAGNGELRIAVCWMLTKDDGRTDGNRRAYLREPGRQQPDPGLHRALGRCRRSVGELSRRRLVPGAACYGPVLGDTPGPREDYFSGFLSLARGRELAFFDPDNGIEVASVPRGRRGSCKYLYLDELARACAAGHSVLVYQHYPRVKREPYRARLADRLCRLTGTGSAWLFSTPQVLFLLLPRPRHRRRLDARAAAFRDGPWTTATGGFRVSRYRPGRVARLTG